MTLNTIALLKRQIKTCSKASDSKQIYSYHFWNICLTYTFCSSSHRKKVVNIGMICSQAMLWYFAISRRRKTNLCDSICQENCSPWALFWGKYITLYIFWTYLSLSLSLSFYILLIVNFTVCWSVFTPYLTFKIFPSRGEVKLTSWSFLKWLKIHFCRVVCSYYCSYYWFFMWHTLTKFANIYSIQSPPPYSPSFDSSRTPCKN